MIRQSFPLLLDPSGKPENLITRLFTAPQLTLSNYQGAASLTPILITIIDTYLTPRSPGAWV